MVKPKVQEGYTIKPYMRAKQVPITFKFVQFKFTSR